MIWTYYLITISCVVVFIETKKIENKQRNVRIFALVEDPISKDKLIDILSSSDDFFANNSMLSSCDTSDDFYQGKTVCVSNINCTVVSDVYPDDKQATELWNKTEDLLTNNNNNSQNSCFLIQYTSTSAKKNETSKPNKYDAMQVWGFGFLSVAIISLSGVFGIIFVPLMKKPIFKVLMRFFVGLGLGTLSSTAVFQLIPESFELKKFSSDYIMSSLIIWLSIWIFLVFESVCKIILNKDQDTSKATAIQSIPNSRKNSYSATTAGLDAIERDTFLPVSYEARWQRNDQQTDVNAPPNCTLQPNVTLLTIPKKAVHHRSHELLTEGKVSISSVAWMIILGDGLHNFIDGISIGAGFTENIMTGVSISLAIMCEEFPHELGDFAILINSGMSVKKALMFNFASACTAFIGLVIGIMLETFEVNAYIFGFAGGLFLYISLADLIPQLNEMINEALEINKKTAWIVLIQQNFGIISGMVILFLLTTFSDNIKI